MKFVNAMLYQVIFSKKNSFHLLFSQTEHKSSKIQKKSEKMENDLIDRILRVFGL